MRISMWNLWGEGGGAFSFQRGYAAMSPLWWPTDGRALFGAPRAQQRDTPAGGANVLWAGGTMRCASLLKRRGLPA
jgi:hypothetical protein